MKLRNYVALSSILVVGVVMGLFSHKTLTTLRHSFEALHQTQLVNIEQVVRSMLDARSAELEGHSRVLRANNDLSSAYLLSREGGDTDLLLRKLNGIRKELGLDLLEITPLEPLNNKVSAVTSPPEGLQLSQREGHPAILVYAPLKLYEASVGRLMLGFYLDGKFSNRLSAATNSLIALGIPKSPYHWKIPEKTGGLASRSFMMQIGNSPSSLLASIQLPDDKSASVPEILAKSLLISGGLSLVLLLMLQYLVLHIGFLRGFATLLKEGQSYSGSVKRGKLTTFPTHPFSILENSALSGVFEHLSESLLSYAAQLKEASRREVEAKFKYELGEIASQVAHDIRSPLSALNVMEPELTKLPEMQRNLLRMAITRIREIADSLLVHHERDKEGKVFDQEKSSEPIAQIIETLVMEKKQELRIRPDINLVLLIERGKLVFANIHRGQFLRVLSNLINNSVEASPSGGNVVVSLSATETEIIIQIRDEGVGISPEVITKLGSRGATFNKEQGLGLGLNHARKTLEASGGNLRIESAVGKGTTATLQIPQCEPPTWHVETITIFSDTQIAIVDDEPTIHGLWETRLRENLGSPDQLQHFYSLQELDNWPKTKNRSRDVLYLFDLEFFGEADDGLTWMENLGLLQQMILVSGRAHDPEVRSRCKKMGVRLISKGAVSWIPIEFEGSSNKAL